jgi:DNA gyrase subunit B
LEKFFATLGYNVLNKSISEDRMQLFVQTDAGLEEITIDDRLFTHRLFAEGLHVYNRLKEKNLSLLGSKTPFEALQAVEDSAKKGAYIQRYKGLGEMNPDQLWETTMDPQNRRLVKVAVENIESANAIFTLFMGDEVEPRRKYIEENAKEVKHLDV